ncbi:phosphatase PAP2 family protein [Streptomyces winkii]|uniref:phosphatase PAP2 family protein n=1 Tax=Streptomyces winkii TaxID=3051178 RepID=UPI0028D27F99|nr:phosphatase PAP2 family protein [Streptomyces sp. DSM 40971]
MFALVTWQVAVDGPLVRIDMWLGGWMQRASPPDAVAEACADLGNPAVGVPVLAAAMTYAVVTGGRRRWLPPLCAALALAGAALAVTLVKVWLGRPGPPGGTNYYPSGHTATAAVAFGGAALLFSMTVGRRPYWPLPATAALLTVACSAGLLWRGYHWPLDVLASWCLSWVLLTSATAVTLRGLRQPSPSSSPSPPSSSSSSP